MSIYPVRLNEWFPKGSEQYEIAKLIVDSERCTVCKKKPQYRWSIGYHALPWGFDSTVWCSKTCFEKR